MSEDEIDYGDAIEELEEILDEIDSDDVDVDDLAEKVQRASELVGLCRDKIDDTEMQVHSIIEDLKEGDSEEEEA